MLNLILASALLVFSAVSAQCQEKRVNPPLPNTNIRESYDRFSDLTSVTVHLSLINSVVDLGGGSVYEKPGPERSLDFVVWGAFFGEDLTRAEPKVTIIINSRSEDWRYLRAPNLLQIIVNGNVRATLGEMKRATSEVVRGGRGVREQLVLEVPFAVIEQLAKSNKLEVRIGLDEFELTKKHLADLQDWVNKFPAAKKK